MSKTMPLGELNLAFSAAPSACPPVEPAKVETVGTDGTTLNQSGRFTPVIATASLLTSSVVML